MRQNHKQERLSKDDNGGGHTSTSSSSSSSLSTSCYKLVAVVTACCALAVVTTLFVVKCVLQSSTAVDQLFPVDKPRWSFVNKLEIPEKGLMVTRLLDDKRCYIMPSRDPQQKTNTGRPMMLFDQLPLTFANIQQLANVEAAAFCAGYNTYMLKPLEITTMTTNSNDDEPSMLNRHKRDNYIAQAMPNPVGPPPSPGSDQKSYSLSSSSSGKEETAAVNAADDHSSSNAPATKPQQEHNAVNAAPVNSTDEASKVPELVGKRVTGDGIFGGAALPTQPVAKIPLDQRKPRCHKIVLDCPNMVGQVQSCFTWQNGRIWMDRQCQDTNKFIIRMTKPPGRILKVAQQEVMLCLKNQREGKAC